jgi:hypothetical protein
LANNLSSASLTLPELKPFRSEWVEEVSLIESVLTSPLTLPATLVLVLLAAALITFRRRRNPTEPKAGERNWNALWQHLQNPGTDLSVEWFHQAYDLVIHLETLPQVDAPQADRIGDSSHSELIQELDQLRWKNRFPTQAEMTNFCLRIIETYPHVLRLA